MNIPTNRYGQAIFAWYMTFSLAVLAYAGVQAYRIVHDFHDAFFSQEAVVRSYDKEKAEIVAEADRKMKEAEEIFDVTTSQVEYLNEKLEGLRDSLESAKRWAADCAAANATGTTTEPVDCSTIQARSAEEQSAKVSELPEVISSPVIAYTPLERYMKDLKWEFKARGEAQSPVLHGYAGPRDRMEAYLEESKFDERFKLTDGYGAELFRRVGKRHGIKPEFLVCVAKADSYLGKHLKSGFNIGNVGNNDRGHTVHFKDIGAGIDAMGRVLNNKYLAHKMSLGSLTPYGGGNPPFYATSPTGNWYNNVRNCLAEILDDPSVGPDFMIRNQ